MSHHNRLIKNCYALMMAGFIVSCSEDPKPKESTPPQEEVASEESQQSETAGEQPEAKLEEIIPMEPQAKDIKRGLYSYYADAALFTDCATNIKYPVAQEDISDELKSTYLALRESQNQKMLMTVKGEYDERTSPDTDDDVDMLIASELISLINIGQCQ